MSDTCQQVNSGTEGEEAVRADLQEKAVADELGAEELSVQDSQAIEDKISSCKASTQVPVALAGRIPVKVDDINGKVSVGDLLTASTVNVGMASKAIGEGWVLGRAMSKDENGTVIMFVMMSYYNPADTAAATIVTLQFALAVRPAESVAVIVACFLPVAENVTG